MADALVTDTLAQGGVIFTSNKIDTGNSMVNSGGNLDSWTSADSFNIRGPLKEHGMALDNIKSPTRYSIKTNLGIEFMDIKKPNIFNRLAYFMLGWTVNYDPDKCDPTDCNKCSKKVECALKKI